MYRGPSILDEKLWFPPPEESDEDGFLAWGGDLSPERLLMAYPRGIFPWYGGSVPLWWSPNPRLVLFPQNLYISKSMRQVLRRGFFRVTHNQCCREVITQCGATTRRNQAGETWITPDLIDAYDKLHKMGYVISFEAWQDQELAGGLYGVWMGQVFFGESMFARVTNASKAAFIHAVQWLQTQGVQLIDCQVETPHLKSLGASLIPRKEFLKLLKQYIPSSGNRAPNLPAPIGKAQ